MPPIEETEKHLKTNNDYLQQCLRRQYPLKGKELGTDTYLYQKQSLASARRR
jgi:hypothetical protein